jgi:hypothetical protein
MKPIHWMMIACIFFAVFISFFVGCNYGKEMAKRECKPIKIAYYRDGDTLLPQPICPDTLIVIDADKLNDATALVEQGYLDASDYQLDSIFHIHCRLLNE